MSAEEMAAKLCNSIINAKECQQLQKKKKKTMKKCKKSVSFNNRFVESVQVHGGNFCVIASNRCVRRLRCRPRAISGNYDNEWSMARSTLHGY